MNHKTLNKFVVAFLFLFLGAVGNTSIIAQNTQIRPVNRNVHSGDQQLFNLTEQTTRTSHVGVMLPKFTSNGVEAANAKSVISQISNYL